MPKNLIMKEKEAKKLLNNKPDLSTYELEENKDFAPILQNMEQLKSNLIDLHCILTESNLSLDVIKDSVSTIKKSSNIEYHWNEFDRLNEFIPWGMHDASDLMNKIEEVHEILCKYMEDLNVLMGYFD